MEPSFEKNFQLLKDWCEKEEFMGWDPYDGLNSRLFQAIPLLSKSRILRLVWIQLFKRSPLNFRKLALVKKEYNPKGLGLFLNGYCNLYRMDPKKEYRDKIEMLSAKILELQSKGFSGACWGYNFDWQAKAFFQPKYSPTVVASTFIGYALLDAYDLFQDEKLLKTARSVCDFILKDLNRTPDENGNFCFSYSPTDHTQVFNASLLGSRMLARVYSYTKESMLIEAAKKSIAFCCAFQKKDGSWEYGTESYQKWIDSFHTGYNLECIFEYQKYSGDTSFQKNIDIGLSYYLKTFFTKEGISNYYHNSTYPIDIHSSAQLIITLWRFNVLKEKEDLVNQVLDWTVRNMQDPKGYFYFQIKKSGTSRIPYIRWAQGWMFFAFTCYFLNRESALKANSK